MTRSFSPAEIDVNAHERKVPSLGLVLDGGAAEVIGKLHVYAADQQQGQQAGADKSTWG